MLKQHPSLMHHPAKAGFKQFQGDMMMGYVYVETQTCQNKQAHLAKAQGSGPVGSNCPCHFLPSEHHLTTPDRVT